MSEFLSVMLCKQNHGRSLQNLESGQQAWNLSSGNQIQISSLCARTRQNPCTRRYPDIFPFWFLLYHSFSAAKSVPEKLELKWSSISNHLICDIFDHLLLISCLKYPPSNISFHLEASTAPWVAAGSPVYTSIYVVPSLRGRVDEGKTPSW